MSRLNANAILLLAIALGALAMSPRKRVLGRQMRDPGAKGKVIHRNLSRRSTMSSTASQHELRSYLPSFKVDIPQVASGLMDRVWATVRRALGVRFERLSDRREARKLEEVLRKMDTHLLDDIGFREISEQATTPDSNLPKPVIIAVSRLLPQWRLIG
jgi:hypothetical protein